jgi:hypothetical protein
MSDICRAPGRMLDTLLPIPDAKYPAFYSPAGPLAALACHGSVDMCHVPNCTAADGGIQPTHLEPEQRPLKCHDEALPG